MKDYSQFPPIDHFMRVLKMSPRSALFYVQIWNKRNKNNGLVIAKKDVRKDFFISQTMCRNLLSPLTFLGLIHFTESDTKFQIDVLGADLNE